MQAHHLNSLAQASLKGYLTTTQNNHGGDLFWSTNRPDCQRSLCQKHSDRLLCPLQVTARPLFRHSWYYRKTRPLSSTFLKKPQFLQNHPQSSSPLPSPIRHTWTNHHNLFRNSVVSYFIISGYVLHKWPLTSPATQPGMATYIGTPSGCSRFEISIYLPIW
jgi:hypothetical protein